VCEPPIFSDLGKSDAIEQQPLRSSGAPALEVVQSPDGPESHATELDATEELGEPAGFRRFVQTLTSTVMQTGATRAAAGLTELLERDVLDPATLGGGAQSALCAAGYATERSGRLVLDPTFQRTLRSWRAVLLEQAVDLSACGASTLDQWASELVAAWLGQPANAADIRRRLRAAGVAAFGMLERAA
jgi:hypothetical protein